MTDAAASVLSGSCDSTALNNEELAFLRRESPAGLTIFRRNLLRDESEPESVSVSESGASELWEQPLTDLIASIQAARQVGTPPMIISVDQEGGRVRRLGAPVPDLGPTLEVAGGGHSQEALDELHAYGNGIGSKLLSYGINCNFAPVVDIWTETRNTSIGDRCFGREAPTVVMRAGAFLAGLTSSGILPCLKHFPGQGHAVHDTHVGSVRVDVSEEQIRKRELFPFQSLHGSCPMVMVSHCIFSALDSKLATKSSVIMDDILRQELGFKGVIVTDDMTMGAMEPDADHWKHSVVESIAAGADLVLVCRSLEKWRIALDALRAEASRNRAFSRRLSEAAGRVGRLRQSIAGS